MASKRIITPVTRIVVDCSTLSGSYALAGKFSFPLVVLKYYNGSSSDVDISIDGTNDHDIAPAGSGFILDVQANREDDILMWPANRPIYVKGSPSSGNLYFVGYRMVSA